MTKLLLLSFFVCFIFDNTEEEVNELSFNEPVEYIKR
jgi:hypothetical protein